MSDRVLDLEWTPAEDVPCRYAEVSQDRSPVHLDAELARRMGLPGEILHGMYVFGRVASHLDRQCRERGDRLEVLHMRFSGISLPGIPIRVAFADTDSGVAITGRQGERTTLSAGWAAWTGSSDGNRTAPPSS